MPAKDLYHDTVVEALKADGWQITDDPLYLGFGGRNLWVDIGAERETLAAEKGDEKIAVEVKSFISTSPVDDLQKASGQFHMYREIIARLYPERILYMAVSKAAFESIFAETLGSLMIETMNIRMIVFDPHTQRIIKWIS